MLLSKMYYIHKLNYLIKELEMTTIVIIILTFLISIYLGTYGVLIVLSVICGVVVSNYKRNKRIETDLQKIKEKLGIEEREEAKVSNEEIEKELESELLSEEENDEKNKHIENEFDEYTKTEDNKKNQNE